VVRAWCSSTLKKTFPLRHRRNARRASGNRTRTALSDVLKTQSPLVGRRSKSQRSLIEVGRAIYGTDSVIHYMLRRTSMWLIRITMTTSLRRNHQCVKARYTTLGATPGTSPGTSSYAETQRRPPQNRGTVTWASLHAHLYDTPRGALSWRHHLSA
jgi:hypothetical protein